MVLGKYQQFVKRTELIKQLHLASGHVGSAKLYGALKQAYYWPSMW